MTGVDTTGGRCVSVHYADSSRINGNHGGAAAHSLPASARQALGMARSNSCENIAVTPDKVSAGVVTGRPWAWRAPTAVRTWPSHLTR